MSDQKEQASPADLVRVKLDGVCHFKFEKKDGTIREAFGTVNPNIIPRYNPQHVGELVEAANNALINMDRVVKRPAELEQDPEGFSGGVMILNQAMEPFRPKERQERAKNDALITFFDIEAQGWRSCNADSILEVL